MNCVVCGSTDLVELHPAEIASLAEVSFSYSFRPEHSRTFRVVRCRACSHRFCAPLPGEVTSSYEDVIDDEYLKHAESRRLAARLVVDLIQRFQPTGKLLDVGCATGDFLTVARERGFTAEGLELSSRSARISRERGFTVHERTLANFASEGSTRYDVIALIGVIEHLSDPRAELEHVVRLLAPGGLLVIWTGDVSSIVARVLGRRWWYWQGQHIQYFTRRSLRLLAEQVGLNEVITTRYPFAATYSQLTNSLRRYRFHRIIAAALRPLFWCKPVIYLRLPGEMLFIARHRSEQSQGGFHHESDRTGLDRSLAGCAVDNV